MRFTAESFERSAADAVDRVGVCTMTPGSTNGDDSRQAYTLDIFFFHLTKDRRNLPLLRAVFQIPNSA
jgi:hypothetical protein